MKKLTSSVLALALLLAVASPSHAFLSFRLKGNGADSRNTARFSLRHRSSVTQVNTTTNTTVVDVDADTGDNEVEDNTNGDNTVDTGDITTTVSVSNTGSMNFHAEDGCECSLLEEDIDVNIVENGKDSNNRVDLHRRFSRLRYQDNLTSNTIGVDHDADTGDNEVEDNTKGSQEVETGDIDLDVTVTNDSGYNENGPIL